MAISVAEEDILGELSDKTRFKKVLWHHKFDRSVILACLWHIITCFPWMIENEGDIISYHI